MCVSSSCPGWQRRSWKERSKGPEGRAGSSGPGPALSCGMSCLHTRRQTRIRLLQLFSSRLSETLHFPAFFPSFIVPLSLFLNAVFVWLALADRAVMKLKVCLKRQSFLPLHLYFLPALRPPVLWYSISASFFLLSPFSFQTLCDGLTRFVVHVLFISHPYFMLVFFIHSKGSKSKQNKPRTTTVLVFPFNPADFSQFNTNAVLWCTSQT